MHNLYTHVLHMYSFQFLTCAFLMSSYMLAFPPFSLHEASLTVYLIINSSVPVHPTLEVGLGRRKRKTPKE